MNGITGLKIEFQVNGYYTWYRGFRLQISKIKNKCTCRSGHPKPNSNCFDDNLEDCDSCIDNYHLINYSNQLSRWYKVSNDYECLSNLTDHNSLSTKKICKPNVCTCANGVPVQSESCVTNNENQCRYCDYGFYLDLNEGACIECAGCFDKTTECFSISAPREQCIFSIFVDKMVNCYQIHPSGLPFF